MLVEQGVEVPRPMQILPDNFGATFIARNPIGQSKLKHVELDLHFVREKTENGDIPVKHIPRKEQWADILTKPLSPKLFFDTQTKLVGEAPRA